MRKPYRIIIWGTGGIGGACLREALRLPEIEVVGVKVYSPEKDGVDIGTLVYRDPVGVIATTDAEKLYALEADCVLHSPRELGDWSQDGVIIRLLESGKNVVTSQAYHWTEGRDPEVIQRIEAACKKGGTCLHASGIDPGFIVERLTLTATGMTNTIKWIKMQEFNELSLLNHDFLSMFGFGHDPNNIPNRDAVAHMADIYLRQSVLFAGERLGVTYERVELTSEYIPAPVDIPLKGFVYKAGTVAYVRQTWTGYVNGEPYFTLQVNWYISDVMKPEGAPSDDGWVISIEGLPTSIRLLVDMRPSLMSPERTYPNDPTIPSYYASAAPMIQAIPVICTSAPGIIHPTLFSNATTDLRKLAEGQ
jgi:hypothetical protein